MSMMIFGLGTYYSRAKLHHYEAQQESDSTSAEYGRSEKDKESKFASSSLVFVFVYVIVLGIVLLGANFNSQIFNNWSHLSIVDIVQLVAAILITFFMPGYALTVIGLQKFRLGPISMLILIYLSSILISSLIGYSLPLYFDIPIAHGKSIILSINTAILIAFIINYLFKHKIHSLHKSRFSVTISRKPLRFVKNRSSELLVFGGLFMILIVYGYYLFGGVTVGDQWFHQGRASLFITGSIREAALTGADDSYNPPLHSSLIAIITLLSGVPIVNAYASIAFLNIMYLFAFYYFFSRWVPHTLQRSNLIATTLFATSSGFGWVYLLGLTATTDPVVSQNSVLNTIVSTEPFDVFQPTNFFPTAHPEFSTALIYIALPAGLFLLGLIRERFQSRVTLTAIVTAISFLGILSHYEFYLFIIVGSILPLFFSLKKGSFIYLGFFIALCSVFIINTFSPAKYYTSIVIFPGFSLLYLGAIFVGGTWVLYIMKKYLVSIIGQIQKPLKKIASNTIKHESDRRYNIRIAISLLIIAAISYGYLLCFLILGHLSLNDIISQSAGYGGPYNVPWYLYPLKLGITGALGTASVLSYIFRRFEKEIFVFGIIGLVALLCGPYYDEHRFSKYILLGMSGFAAILLYKILVWSSRKISVLSGIIIPAVMLVASLSSFIYIGFNSLILETGDFTHTLGRRDFPESEMSMFKILSDKLDIESNRYNILTFADEYSNLDDGLMGQLQAFVGLPSNIIYQNPLTMNMSHLDSFYHLLADSGIKYIILPKQDIRINAELTEPVAFALDHFSIIYQNKKYVVLEVPKLGPVTNSIGNDIALVYDQDKKDGVFPSTANVTNQLVYNNSTFNFDGKTNFVVVERGNKTERVILSDYDSSKGISIPSYTIATNYSTNYLELGLKILNENNNKSSVAGIEWIEDDGKRYHLLLSDQGLRLFEKNDKVENKDYAKLVYENIQFGKKLLTDYTVKLERFGNSIDVFLNDRLVISMPTIAEINKNVRISHVAITSTNSTVEFTPIKIGHVSNQTIDFTKAYHDYYYPLTIAALSENGYDLFSDNDMSAFSKKELFLTFDPTNWDNTTFSQYLEYVNNGGKLIVLNSDFIDGKFGKLISLNPSVNNTGNFDSITSKNNQSIDISGDVMGYNIEQSPDITVISNYVDKANNTVAPFIIKKTFSYGGEMLLVNSEGLFKSLSKTPRSNFQLLSNISKMMELHTSNDRFSNNISRDITAQQLRVIGNLDLSGNISLRTSSLLLPELEGSSKNMHAERIVFVAKAHNQTNVFNNITFNKLELVGTNEIAISSKGTISLPSKYSENEYISFNFPGKLDIIVSQNDNKPNLVKFVAVKGLPTKSFDLTNVSVSFHNVSQGSAQKSILVLVKDPVVKATGHIGLKGTNFDRYFRNYAIPLNVPGELNTQLDFVDDYEQSFSNGTTKMQYITFLKDISINRTKQDNGINIQFPGDISPYAKNQGPQIPIKQSLFSLKGILFLLIILLVTLMASITLTKLKTIT